MKPVIRVFLATLILFGLTGCTANIPSVQPSASTPRWVSLRVTLSAAGLREQIQSCLPDGAGLAYEEAATPGYDPALDRLVLRWGEPVVEAPAGSFPVGSQTLAVVVHPDNPVQSLTLDTLRGVFGGAIRAWNEIGGNDLPIQPWAYPAASDAWEVFESVTGPLTLDRRTGIAPGPLEMRSAVAADPSAVGFLPADLVDSSLRVVEMQGLTSAALARPLLVLAPDRLSGDMRALIACLQKPQP